MSDRILWDIRRGDEVIGGIVTIDKRKHVSVEYDLKGLDGDTPEIECTLLPLLTFHILGYERSSEWIGRVERMWAVITTDFTTLNEFINHLEKQLKEQGLKLKSWG